MYLPGYCIRNTTLLLRGMLDILMIQQIRSKAIAIIYHQLLTIIFNHPQPYKGTDEVPTVDQSGAMWHVACGCVTYSLSFPFSAFLVCS